ncbi:fbff99f8-5ec0-439c-b664-917015173b98 [Thermothielavioides terrestris]|uniref:ubiquitinyl hydrolase 1 n=1 Tax=Thermothielavioides terrestris TaxID=2587410 RepID=A0A3S4BND3_9PEZI|nr:fbff99f8-5ec0-439c-b664-917015173b98 [Thermothielavioides terrestris]
MRPSELGGHSGLLIQVAEPRVPGKGGRLASRLIQDWFAGRLAQNEQGDNGSVGLPTDCPSLRVFPPRPEAGPEHDLLIIQSQSYDDAHDPNNQGRSLVCCMCRYCRYHFVFHIYPPAREDGTTHMQHHLRLKDFQRLPFASPPPSPPSTRRPQPCRFLYDCTVCGMVVCLDMSLPRLQSGWIELITDENRIREALRIAREQDPGRYGDISPEKENHYLTTALSTLNQYLKNILDDDGSGPRKRISCRNKTFLVQFGQDCDQMFRYLGFEQQHDPATGEWYWLPPVLPPQSGKTPLNSPRAFIEDVRSEVQSLLDDKPLPNGQPVVKPFSARDQLEKALGCDKTPRSAGPPSIDSSELQHFTTLGAPVGASDELLKFAYRRQVETDPEGAPSYLEALGTLSGRRAEELQMFVFGEQELLAEKDKQAVATATAADPETAAIERAYAHFALRRDCPEAPAYFINVYRNYREQSPAQKSDHRLALLTIGRDRHSEEIEYEVYMTDMELSEACRFLGVDAEWPLDNIAAMAQSVASEMDLKLVLMALDTIGRSRPADDPNRYAFDETVLMLRSGLPSSPLDSSATPTAEPSREVVDMELPVGLANLRNTCYLNSILQYFYSVNAVRDLAMNVDLPALQPTEENLSNLLRATNSGGSDSSPSGSSLETGRAFVGHEFTRELSTLFRELDATGSSWITPRQRLANAALLRPEKLRPRSEGSETAPSSNNDAGPPLPPRTAHESSVPHVPDAPMTEPECCETASAASSQTLVNQAGEEGAAGATTEPRDAEKDAPTAADELVAQTSARPKSDQPARRGVRMSKLTVEELAVELDKPNVGSDQMDVDEVMGNAIDHLRAAFKVSRIGSSEAAPDPIQQAFFSTFIDNRKKIGDSEWNRSRRSDRWVTAYPAQSGTRDLYDALANSFDLEPLPGDLLSFTTIERPAPHFHICIQRSDGVRKNSNPITIPNVLYLDRFMHAADNQSVLSRERRRRWDITTRLNEISSSKSVDGRPETAKAESRVAGHALKVGMQEDDLAEEEIDGFLVIGSSGVPAVDSSSPPAAAVNGTGGAEDVTPDSELKRLLVKYGLAEPAFARSGSAEPPPYNNTNSTKTTTLLPSDIDAFWERFAAEEDAERQRLTAERDRIFADAHNVAYLLHAVVCHAGASASAGHYWVWIHDFERDVWRKYNDTTVSVHPADFVFQELNTKGEPYYLAYVRADEVAHLVSIPRRHPPTPPPVPPRPQPQPQPERDIVMVDADGPEPAGTAVEHLEDVDMQASSLPDRQ